MLKISEHPPDVPVRTSIRVQAFLASTLMVLLSCITYSLLPSSQKLLSSNFGAPEWMLSGRYLLVIGGFAYVIALAIYHAVAEDISSSKSLRFVQLAGKLVLSPASVLARKLVPTDRVAVLATLLKFYFAPLMVMSLLSYTQAAWNHGVGLMSIGFFEIEFRKMFDLHLFWFLFHAIILVDIVFFAAGYLIESRRLGNEIRSVDPTFLGWVVAMLCYPPFNAVSEFILGSSYANFPQFESTFIHVGMNALMLALLAIYASASVALGWRASNLTHRGIVDRGPYSYVRHPAYTCKTLAWAISAIPLTMAAFGQSFFDGAIAVASIAGWTGLYALRAVTEEDHLRSVDSAYDAYAQRVRYRFLPGVL